MNDLTINNVNKPKTIQLPAPLKLRFEQLRTNHSDRVGTQLSQAQFVEVLLTEHEGNHLDGNI